MPEFKLEFLKPKPQDVLRERILYTKGTYNKVVKITDWQQYLSSFPIDNDPYCPGSRNYFLSHHKRFGDEKEDGHFETVTHLTLDQIKTKQKLSDCQLPKHLIHFRTFKKDCEPNEGKPVPCTSFIEDDFLTTMKASYTAPYPPFTPQPIKLPAIPFLQYRKFKQVDPIMSDNMFYDEGFEENVSMLQKYKSARWISFNPLTGTNSDGT